MLVSQQWVIAASQITIWWLSTNSTNGSFCIVDIQQAEKSIPWHPKIIIVDIFLIRTLFPTSFWDIIKQLYDERWMLQGESQNCRFREMAKNWFWLYMSFFIILADWSRVLVLLGIEAYKSSVLVFGHSILLTFSAFLSHSICFSNWAIMLSLISTSSLCISIVFLFLLYPPHLSYVWIRPPLINFQY